MPKLRNIIIFVSIAAVLVLIYIFFIAEPDVPDTNLITSSNATLPDIDSASTLDVATSADSKIAGDFLALLLSVKNIKLDDSIFATPAWSNLKDSSIELTPDHSEGRPNPFAPFGADNTEPIAPPAIPAPTPAPYPIPQ